MPFVEQFQKGLRTPVLVTPSRHGKRCRLLFGHNSKGACINAYPRAARTHGVRRRPVGNRPRHTAAAYYFWWHLGHDTMVTSEWGPPNMVRNGLIPELLLAEVLSQDACLGPGQASRP